MIEIDFNTNITQDKIKGQSADELEDFIASEIAYGLSVEMKKHIDEMSFIDMQWNEEEERFDITAELVLCSKQDIVTNAEIQAQLMANYGLTEEQILNVLETQLIDNKGF